MFVSCGQRSSENRPDYRPFPLPEIPGVICDATEAQSYVLAHYWDKFLQGTGKTDTSAIKGVKTRDLEQALANYINMLPAVPMEDASHWVSKFFVDITESYKADTTSNLFPVFTEMVAKYLYDPNSPMRNEDYFLPFAEGLSHCPYIEEGERLGYKFQFEKCCLNRYGTVAPDFGFKDAKGREKTMHGIKADYTMVFFSNPGCHECLAIIEQVSAKPYIDQIIQDGHLAILNIYIDKDLKAWREYQTKYPANWITGYDHKYIIRDDELYYVRAIPSLYLLDKDKRILMRDAPTEKVLFFLDQKAKSYGY